MQSFVWFFGIQPEQRSYYWDVPWSWRKELVSFSPPRQEENNEDQTNEERGCHLQRKIKHEELIALLARVSSQTVTVGLNIMAQKLCLSNVQGVIRIGKHRK